MRRQPKTTATIALAIILQASNYCHAEGPLIDLYGELDISRDHIEGVGNAWVSNVSRLGIRGTSGITSSVSVLYQFEQEVDVIHGGFEQDTLLSIRNSFVGLKGDFGSIIVGTHDTPLKKAQGKVDRFNDQLGDIRSLFVGEVRARDSIMYVSPPIGDGFEARALYVPPDEAFGNSHSFSIAYNTGEVIWAVAFDSDMRKNDRAADVTRVYDSLRGSVEFSSGLWKFGLMGQASRDDTVQPAAGWESGLLVSVSRPIGAFEFDAQYAESDIVNEGDWRVTAGLGYSPYKNLRLYGIVTTGRSDGSDVDVFAIGTEFKF